LPSQQAKSKIKLKTKTFPHLVFSAINLKEGDVAFAVDFIARRMSVQTLGQMSLQTLAALQVFEAVFTQVQHRVVGQLLDNK
jgi:hypothetical protein